MGRAGASARAKARQLTVNEFRRLSKWVAAGATGGGLLGLSHGLGAGATGAALGAAGVAVLGHRRVIRAGARWRQGGDGEKRTGSKVKPLVREGWHVFDDLSIPGSKANLDHVWVVPSGLGVVVGDTKAWHAKRAKVRLLGADLFYGPWCQNGAVSTIEWETQQVRERLGVPAVSFLVLDRAEIDRGHHPGGWIKVNEAFWVVEQATLPEALRAVRGGDPNKTAAKRLARDLTRQFPQYRRSRR